MTQRAKQTLIIARTAVEAEEYAVAHGITDWFFVVHAHELFSTSPTTHRLVFTGDWRNRPDVVAIRDRARTQGFKVPR